MDEDKIIEAFVRAVRDRDCGDPSAPFPCWECDMSLEGGSGSGCLLIASAAWDTAKAALAEAGFVIAKKQEPQPKETFAEEVARLQREIGQRQLRLQYLVCGDPGIMVTFPTVCGDLGIKVTIPTAAAPDQR